jgi:hypothetical protein
LKGKSMSLFCSICNKDFPDTEKYLEKSDIMKMHEKNERVLRAYAYNERYLSKMEPMTEKQRKWCIEQINQAGEGTWTDTECSDMSDEILARTVLHAWNDYIKSHF